VAGINFLFYLKNQNDSTTFVAEVFNPLYGNVQILNTWENATISNSITGEYEILSGDYSSDPDYMLAYNAAISSYPVLKNALVTQVQ
jgi:hypothetical protein